MLNYYPLFLAIIVDEVEPVFYTIENSISLPKFLNDSRFKGIERYVASLSINLI